MPVGALVAQGDVDLGFQQLSELLNVPGIDVVGPLPPDIQAITVFTARCAATSSQHDEARALVAYLASPETDAAKRPARHGAGLNAAIFEEPKIDCHVHVLDPARFPYRADTHYAPSARRSARRRSSRR